MTVVVETDDNGARRASTRTWTSWCRSVRVDDITSERRRSSRDLALIKVSARPAKRAPHVMQLVDVYRRAVVDVGPDIARHRERPGRKTRSTASSKCCVPTACWRWSAPDAWRWMRGSRDAAPRARTAPKTDIGGDGSIVLV